MRILFDQKVIPNYRVGVYEKLATTPEVCFAVSYWTENRPLDSPAQADEEFAFETVPFCPRMFRVFGRHYWLNLDLVFYVLRERPQVVIGATNLFCLHSLLSKAIEDALRLISDTRFVYRVSFGLLPGASPRTSPRGLRKLWYRWLYRNVVVLAYNQRAAEIARGQGCSPERVLVDYNAMDSDELLSIRARLEQITSSWEASFLSRYGLERGEFVLFVSRISPNKRLDVLIEAWRRVAQVRPEARLVVVGDGPGREEAMRQAQDLREQVAFVGGIYDTEELARFYLLASLVVYPGYATLSTHFAMCFGKPIVTSQYGNEAEYVEDGVNGLVYEYGNTADLAEKTLRLLNDGALRCQYGRAAERLVREKINVGHMVQTFLAAARLAVGRA